MKSSRGFTLIELIVVITILGILAAVALPRFVGLERDARIAKLAAARGALAAASGLVHGIVLTRAGQTLVACPAGGTASYVLNGAGTACTENGVVATQHGYPSTTALAAATPGIIAAAGLTSIFNPTLAQLQAEGYSVTVAGTVTTVAIQGPAVGTCEFTYTHSAAFQAAPVFSASTITGC